MKKRVFSVLVAVMLLFMLVSCDRNIGMNEGENLLEVGNYGLTLNMNSNSADLIVGLTEKDYSELIKNQLENGSSLTLPGWEVNAGLMPCAHDEITCVDDILNGKCWYTAMAKNGMSSEMDPETKRYLDGENLYGKYIGKFEFTVALSETAPEGDYSFTVTSVEFPENNAFSVFVVGTDDFVEFNSVGNNSRSNSILVNGMSREEKVITVFVYVDGNDERVTNACLTALNQTTGEIKIGFDLVKK